MNASLPRVSICILTYNRCALLRGLLAEVAALTYAPLEVIVVDNHSEDGTQQMVQSEFGAVRYIRADRNLGAAGRNLGMQAATGEFVVTLDDDVSGLDDGGLRALVELFGRSPRVGAINFRVTRDGSVTCNWIHHCRVEDHETATFLTYEITEGAVAFRAQALRQAGYYPDGFFLSHEGPDLAFRLFECGFEVIYCGAIRVLHGFAPQSRQPWRNYYYDTRNQLWLAARNFPSGYAAAYLARGLSSTFVYALRDGYLRYWFRAVGDGLLGIGPALAQRRVLSRSTMRVLRAIDAQRPSLLYLARKRLFTRDGLLFK